MKRIIRFTSIIVLVMTIFILVGCTGTHIDTNDMYIVQNGDVSESKEMETSSERKQKVQYYDNMDSHIQLLYEGFVLCDWVEISDILEELKRPDEKRVEVYSTPVDGLFLVVEYLPEACSWQAYLGEFINGQKKGIGIMVSKRGTGYVSDNIYIGAWDNNLPNGKGMLSDSIYDMEYIFSGMFVDGKFDSAIQVHELETSELYVEYLDWGVSYTEGTLNYADIIFDNGKPIPVTTDIVEQYIEISQLTARELEWLELESDGQYYYRVYNDCNNYIFTVGAKPPADGYRGEIKFVYGTLFDLNDEEATYGVACYTSNRTD